MNLIDRQKENLIRAFEKNDLDYSSLNRIIKKCRKDLHLEIQPVESEDDLRNKLTELDPDAYLNFSFSFKSLTVTERATGLCKPLKKWLKANTILDVENVLKELSEAPKYIFIISANPYFLIGSSVRANGEQLENSCHYPGKEHACGSVSYALDSITYAFFKWSLEDNGIIGRQMIYLNAEKTGLVTGRKFGDFTDSDSSYLRPFFYKALNLNKNEFKKAKSDDFSFDDSEYKGYLDSGCFALYRTEQTTQNFILAAPLCISCGSEHRENTIICCDKYSCACCGFTTRDEEELTYVDAAGGSICESCLDNNYSYCEACGEYCDSEEVHEAGNTGNYYCEYHLEKKGYVACSECGEYRDDCLESVDGELICEDCQARYDYRFCKKCNFLEKFNYMSESIEGNLFCGSCVEDLNKCDCCGDYQESRLTKTVWNTFLCDNCIDKHATDTCPGCGLAQDSENACSHTCATNNLFRRD